MSKLELLLLAPEHLDAVAAIEAEVSERPWSRQLFADELALIESSRHWLVAAEDDEIVGFAGSMFVDSDAHLMNIAVSRGHRRKGVARRLMLQMMGDIRRGGYLNMTLEVRPDNDAALALYRQFGFAPGGIRKAYYPNGQDALLLWVHDLDSAAYKERLDRMVQPC